MFNRNEWLQWAQQNQQNNPMMKDFRSGYWKNIQEESVEVDEGLRTVVAGRLQKGIDKTKKYLKNPETWGRFRAGVGSGGQAATSGYVWSKVTGPSKEEIENQKRMSPTRINTQHPVQESVEKEIHTTLLTKMKKVQNQIKEDNGGTMQGLMAREQRGTVSCELSESVEYRLAELGYQLDEAAFLAAIPALLSSMGTAAAGAGSAIAGAAGGALASGGAMAGRAALTADKYLKKVPSNIKKVPNKRQKIISTVAPTAAMAPFMMMGGQPKPDTTAISSAPQASPSPATGQNSATTARQLTRARARNQLR